MNSHEREPELDSADGDVTMPAGDDVVAQIRAHAAKIRGEASPSDAADSDLADSDLADSVAADSVEADSGPLKIWTPEVKPDEDDTALINVPSAAPERLPQHEPQRRQLLPHDETVAFTSSSPVPEAAASPAAAVSLIDGIEPPESSVAFWADRPFRASGIEVPSRLHRARTVPLWVWIACVVVLIVVVSLGMAITVATIEPLT